MATNYVEIKIKASDTAKPDLTELKLQLDELGRKAETAKVSIDDKDSEAKLLRLNAQLAELNKKVSAKRPLDVSGATKVQADLAAINNGFDKLKTKADEFLKQAGPQGLLNKLLYGSSGGGGIAGIGSSIGGIGSSIGNAGGGTLFTNPYSLAAIAAGISALLPELVGLASGFTAAGAGAGAFYLLAHPAISNLTQDTQNLLAANDKLQQAQNMYAVDPTKAHAKALKEAQDNLKAVQMSMGQDAGGAAAGIVKLRTEYDKLTTAFQPDVFKVFNAGLKIANKLLPDVMPFAKTFADVLDRLLGQAGKFASSKGFADWLKQFHGLEGPALDAIGKGFGQVAIQVGKLLTVMSSKDVVNSINIAFNVLSGTIDGFRHVVEAIMRAWDVSSKTIARDSREVAAAFDALRHDIADFAHDVAARFDEVRAAIARFFAFDPAGWVSRWFKTLSGDMLQALGALPGLLFKAGQAAIQGLLDGMKSMMGGAYQTVAGWGHDLLNALGSPFGIHFSEPSEATQMVKAGRNIAAGLSAGMLSGQGGVAAAASRLSGAAAFGPAGGGGGGGGITIEFHVDGGAAQLGAQFWQQFQQGIRVKGGDPQIVTRKVKLL